MAEKWNAIAIAHGARYAVQVDTWASYIRRHGGRPYVHCDYAEPPSREIFFRRRPEYIRAALAACAEVGRQRVTVTDVDARFGAPPDWPAPFEAARIDAAALWRPSRQRYEPGVLYLSAGPACEDLLARWGTELASGAADDVALTSALNQVKALGARIEIIPESAVAVPAWAHNPPNPILTMLARGWEHVEVTPETIGREVAAGGVILEA